MVSIFPAEVQEIVQALQGYETRAVGGWVRSLLRGEPMVVNGIGVECDLATTATPDQMEERFNAAGLGFSDEGRRWGSLAVLAEGGKIEITSLRQDTYAAGSRYPNVTFVTDWALDAARRDFTFNAIYMAADGTAYDPYGGQNDLAGGVVKFIGDPALRLREDPLRWLRFWRFCARYGLAGYLNERADELKAVLNAAAPALRNLSRHRVAREWEKLQAAPHAAEVVKIIRLEGWLKLINERLGHGAEEN